MIQIKNIKRWFIIHRWTSLICTVFLLILCITGLLLIFGDEIDHWLNDDPPYEVLANDSSKASLDPMVELARQRYPKEVVSYVFIDDTAPQVLVNMLPAYGVSADFSHSLQFDSRTGKLLKDAPPKKETQGFTSLMLALHSDLFMNLPGELFLALMGILFVVSLISGAVLYGPFMKKIDFGAIRRARSKRLKWLDLHNLLGIATFIWLLVVGATGIMNELSTPLFGLWQSTDVKAMLKNQQAESIKEQVNLSSVQAAYETAQSAIPENTITSVVFPGHAFSSPREYLIWTKGDKPLTARLFSPVLVDARSGALVAILDMPWYLRLLQVSRPLHFGDYGGIPLKIIWAIFDIIAIIVLISGVYLWFVRTKVYKAFFLKYEFNEGNHEQQ